MKVKIAIVGGGASGLMAACAAAHILKEPGAVTVLEGSEKPGRKLLATGNGRCNLTNTRHMTAESFFGDAEQIPPLLSAYPPERIRSLFREMGLLTVSDSEGRVYPQTMQAASVLAVLVRTAERYGAEIRCGAKVVSVEKVRDGFRLTLENGDTVDAAQCILALGGAASPRLSCGVDGYALAKTLGHSVTDLLPALTGLLCETSRKVLRPLAGVRCAAGTALKIDGKTIAESPAEEKSEVIFSETGIAGISVFDLSVFAAEALAHHKSAALSLDLWRDASYNDVVRYLQEIRDAYPASPCGELLLGVLHRNLSWALARAAGSDPAAAAKSLSDHQIKRLASLVKNWEFPVTGVRGWDNAQITAGGVPLAELDTLTFASKKTKGLYLTGELINIHGRCGGYNLHFAWATGHAAGTAAANAQKGVSL